MKIDKIYYINLDKRKDRKEYRDTGYVGP